MQLQGLKQVFLEHLELKLGRSAKTIENYDRYLKRFLTFSGVKKPSELTVEKIEKFKLYLKQQGELNPTIVIYLKRETQSNICYLSQTTRRNSVQSL